MTALATNHIVYELLNSTLVYHITQSQHFPFFESKVRFLPPWHSCTIFLCCLDDVVKNKYISGVFVIVDNNLDYETNCWLIGIGVDGNQVGANDPTRQCCGTHPAIVLSSKYYKAQFLVVQISLIVTYFYFSAEF